MRFSRVLQSFHLYPVSSLIVRTTFFFSFLFFETTIENDYQISFVFKDIFLFLPWIPLSIPLMQGFNPYSSAMIWISRHPVYPSLFFLLCLSFVFINFNHPIFFQSILLSDFFSQYFQIFLNPLTILEFLSIFSDIVFQYLVFNIKLFQSILFANFINEKAGDIGYILLRKVSSHYS